MTTPTKATRRRASGAGGRRAGTGASAEGTRTSTVAKRTAKPANTAEPVARAPRKAADKATRKNSTQLTVPFVGTVKLPATDELAFLGGIGVLAILGAIEWPIAVAVGAGHALAANRRNKVVEEFGEALERA